MSFHLEFQLTQDEFAEAFSLATARIGKVRSVRRIRLTSIAAAGSVAMFVLALLVLADLNLAGLDWSARTLASALEIPGPWAFLFLLLQIPRLRISLGKRAMEICYIVLACGFLVFAIFVALNRTGTGQTFLICCVFLAAMFWQYGKLVFRTLNMPALWKIATHLHGICRVDADEQHINFAYPTRRTEYDWIAINSWRESKSVLIVMLVGGAYHIIPKRAFRDNPDLQAFRDLLTEATKPRKGAFEVIPLANLAPVTDQQQSRNPAGL